MSSLTLVALSFVECVRARDVLRDREARECHRQQLVAQIGQSERTTSPAASRDSRPARAALRLLGGGLCRAARVELATAGSKRRECSLPLCLAISRAFCPRNSRWGARRDASMSWPNPPWRGRRCLDTGAYSFPFIRSVTAVAHSSFSARLKHRAVGVDTGMEAFPASARLGLVGAASQSQYSSSTWESSMVREPPSHVKAASVIVTRSASASN